MSEGPETLTRLLWEGRYLSRWPADHEVVSALEVLRDENGELLA